MLETIDHLLPDFGSLGMPIVKSTALPQVRANPVVQLAPQGVPSGRIWFRLDTIQS